MEAQNASWVGLHGSSNGQVERKQKFGVVQRHKRALQVFSSSISLTFNDKMSENFHRWSGRECGWEVTMQMRRGTGGKVLGGIGYIFCSGERLVWRGGVAIKSESQKDRKSES